MMDQTVDGRNGGSTIQDKWMTPVKAAHQW